MSDLISRQAAIRWVKTECNPYGKPTLDFESGKKVIEHLEQMPSADRPQEWIPCSERLPEKEKPYHRRDFFLTTNAYGAVNVTTYEFENDFQKRGWQSDIRIIAWMPLPKPYDGERRDDE